MRGNKTIHAVRTNVLDYTIANLIYHITHDLTWAQNMFGFEEVKIIHGACLELRQYDESRHKKSKKFRKTGEVKRFFKRERNTSCGTLLA